MKKVTIILVGLIMVSLLTTSCQEVKEPEGKKETQQIQKEEVKQPLEAKPEFQPKEQKPPAPPEVKEEKKEESKEVKTSPLTEKEQREFEKFGGDFASPNAFQSEKQAIKYLKILIKGDHRTIRWYQSYDYYPTDKDKRKLYGEDIGTALSVINTKTNKEGFNLAIEVLKTKREYPEALAGTAEALGRSEDKSIIPLLKDVVKNPNVDVRLKAGKALVLLGEIDTALPVLDELTKEGATAALGYIFHNMQGKEWEQRGIELIKKALTYENNESKALAALFLIGLTKKGFIREDLRKLEDVLVGIAEEILNKKKWTTPSRGYNERRALETVILAFEELNSKKAIPLLHRVIKHPEASYLEDNASKAIAHIESSGEGRK